MKMIISFLENYSEWLVLHFYIYRCIDMFSEENNLPLKQTIKCHVTNDVNKIKKIYDMVAGGSLLASGAQPPASVMNFFPSQ